MAIILLVRASCWLRRRKVGGWRRAGLVDGSGWGLAAKYFFRVLKVFLKFSGARPPPRPPTHSLRGFFPKNKGVVFSWFSTSRDAGASVVGGVEGRLRRAPSLETEASDLPDSPLGFWVIYLFVEGVRLEKDAGGGLVAGLFGLGR